MRQLARSITTLLIGVAVFYNIERLDIGEVNAVDIDSSIYILGFIAIISIIGIPALRRSDPLVLIVIWLGEYLLVKLLLLAFFDGRPLLGSFYTYLSITEMALLLILTWLAHKVAIGLRDFEEAVERITFSNGHQRIRQLREAEEEIQIEMFRSRHHHRPLSVIVVEPDPESIQTALHHLVQEVQRAMLSGYVVNNMAQTLAKYLRRTDLILEQRDRGRFLILCPETDAADSKPLVEHIQTVVREQLDISIAYGTATFPDEAVTFEELVHQAESHLHRPTEQESA